MNSMNSNQQNNKLFTHGKNLVEMVFTTPVDANLTKNTPNVATIFKGMVDQHFQGNSLIYTVSSLQQNEGSKVGASMYVETDNKNYRWKLKDYHSILAAELFAL